MASRKSRGIVEAIRREAAAGEQRTPKLGILVQPAIREYKERPSRTMAGMRMETTFSGISEVEVCWENDTYYGLLRRYSGGFPIGGGPWAVISITSRDETARHDWREFQQIKNELLGDEWEGVELYPAESRLIDPSNRFYIWCAPRGVFNFGLPEAAGRRVIPPQPGCPAQRPFG